MKKEIFMATFLACAVLLSSPEAVYAGDCMACHQKYNVTVKVPAPQPIKMSVDGTVQILTLQQAFLFHGHECPGITIAYRAAQHGIELLFPGEIPRREDLVISSSTPAGGVKDFLDLLMKGDNPAGRTWPPVGMQKGRDRFVFTMMRKSTSEAVTLRLNTDLFPADFYPLKKKEKDKTITKAESNKLHGYVKNILMEVPVKPARELFGAPKPSKVIVWGTLERGEMDKNIRKLRQEEKKKALQNVQLENKKQEGRI